MSYDTQPGKQTETLSLPNIVYLMFVTVILWPYNAENYNNYQKCEIEITLGYKQ